MYKKPIGLIAFGCPLLLISAYSKDKEEIANAPKKTADSGLLWADCFSNKIQNEQEKDEIFDFVS